MKDDEPARGFEPLVNTAQAAELLGVSERYLEILRVRGGGPAFIRLGRSIRYRRSALGDYANDNTRRSTSERRDANSGGKQ